MSIENEKIKRVIAFASFKIAEKPCCEDLEMWNEIIDVAEAFYACKLEKEILLTKVVNIHKEKCKVWLRVDELKKELEGKTMYEYCKKPKEEKTSEVHCCGCGKGCWHKFGEGEHLWCHEHHPWGAPSLRKPSEALTVEEIEAIIKNWDRDLKLKESGVYELATLIHEAMKERVKK